MFCDSVLQDISSQLLSEVEIGSGIYTPGNGKGFYSCRPGVQPLPVHTLQESSRRDGFSEMKDAGRIINVE